MDIFDLADPEFNGSMSSDELYYGGEVNIRLTDVIAHKSDYDHTHTGYATADHSHSEYATQIALDTLGEEVDGKADSGHTHTEYATSSHSHNEYASSTHSHAEYSAVKHSHDENYSPIDHTHANYATITALNEVSSAVSGKANTSHIHDDRYYTETEVDTKLSTKANASHTHIINSFINYMYNLKINRDWELLENQIKSRFYLVSSF